MKGILKAISIQRYGLYEGKNPVFQFTVLDPKLRVKSLDPLQGQVVDFEKQIKPLLKK